MNTIPTFWVHEYHSYLLGVWILFLPFGCMNTIPTFWVYEYYSYIFLCMNTIPTFWVYEYYSYFFCVWILFLPFGCLNTIPSFLGVCISYSYLLGVWILFLPFWCMKAIPTFWVYECYSYLLGVWMLLKAYLMSGRTLGQVLLHQEAQFPIDQVYLIYKAPMPLSAHARPRETRYWLHECYS